MNLAVLDKDIVHTARELYVSIDRRYKTAFCISLVCTILAFFIFFLNTCCTITVYVSPG